MLDFRVAFVVVGFLASSAAQTPCRITLRSVSVPYVHSANGLSVLVESRDMHELAWALTDSRRGR